MIKPSRRSVLIDLQETCVQGDDCSKRKIKFSMHVNTKSVHLSPTSPSGVNEREHVYKNISSSALNL